jgi:hypothetical protein
MEDRGSRIEDRRSTVEDRGTQTECGQSKVNGFHGREWQSSILDPRSSIFRSGAGQGDDQQEHDVRIETIVKFSRFHGSVPLDPVRLGRDAGRIAEEVVQHLTSQVDAQIEVTLEIQAKLPEGASEKLVRDVTENCRTLRFNNYGFEEA